MQETRTVEIDLDVHKLLELSRESFGETDNEVLRRLLKLPKLSDRLNGSSVAEQNVLIQKRAWGHKGVTLPHGTQLRMSYNGKEYRGIIDDGKWLVDGKFFKSPSGAASGVAQRKDGGYASIDGWNYWEVKRPGDQEWIPIRFLRRMQGENRDY